MDVFLAYLSAFYNHQIAQNVYGSTVFFALVSVDVVSNCMRRFGDFFQSAELDLLSISPSSNSLVAWLTFLTTYLVQNSSLLVRRQSMEDINFKSVNLEL